MAKASNTATFRAKPRRKLRRHTKHANKHKSSKTIITDRDERRTIRKILNAKEKATSKPEAAR